MPNGWPVTLAVLWPNLLWLLLPPRDAPSSSPPEFPRWVGVLETVGRLGVFVVPCFSRVEFAGSHDWGGVGVMGLALAIYYGGWTRYFLMGRRYELLYRSLLKFPIPLAVSPVVYFIAAAAVLNSAALAAMSVLFGDPHIYLSYRESRRVRAAVHSQKEALSDAV